MRSPVIVKHTAKEDLLISLSMPCHAGITRSIRALLRSISAELDKVKSVSRDTLQGTVVSSALVIIKNYKN